MTTKPDSPVRACLDCGEPIRKVGTKSARCRVCAARASLRVEQKATHAWVSLEPERRPRWGAHRAA